jgi:hypothetical protein
MYAGNVRSAVCGHRFGNISNIFQKLYKQQKSPCKQGLFLSLHLKEEVIMLSSDTCF